MYLFVLSYFLIDVVVLCSNFIQQNIIFLCVKMLYVFFIPFLFMVCSGYCGMFRDLDAPIQPIQLSHCVVASPDK